MMDQGISQLQLGVTSLTPAIAVVIGAAFGTVIMDIIIPIHAAAAVSGQKPPQIRRRPSRTLLPNLAVVTIAAARSDPPAGRRQEKRRRLLHGAPFFRAHLLAVSYR